MRKHKRKEPDQVYVAEETQENDVSRRKMLKALGRGGLLIACAPLIQGTTALAAGVDDKKKVSMEQQPIFSVPNVEALKKLSAKERKNGMAVNVLGYQFPGDGGQKMVAYFSDSKQEDNGGTVHKPEDGKGAWHCIHYGIGKFSWFGHHDESKPCDAALDALVTDESFYKIEAGSNLLMVKRHIFHRSNIELDFQNHTIFTYGAENANRDNPFAAMMFFQGVKKGEPFTVTLPGVKDAQGRYLGADFCEDSDYLYAGDNRKFGENEWYFVETNIRPREDFAGRAPIGGGGSDKEIQKLLMVTKVGKSAGDQDFVGFNYLNAWALHTGRKITYQRIEPVCNVNIKNMKFEGQGHSDTTGTSPVAHEFCVDCNITNIQAQKVFWPLNLRRYCTRYEVRDCMLINPEEVAVGGTGYLIQQIGCLYGTVANCRAHNVRHLNDFTGCAYSLVENCHCTGDENGAFVTHGQYDHDLTYIGNSGFLSFANSALNANDPHMWGGWHKRIVVKKHQAPRVVFENKMNRVVDMTLEDCYVYKNTERYGGNAGSVWANVDGLVMRNCVIKGPLALGEDSSVSDRPTLIEGCTVEMIDGHYLTRHRGSKYEVERELTFRNCTFKNIGLNFIVKGTKINFDHCDFYADPNAAVSRLNVETEHVVISGGGFHGVCFAFDKGGTTKESVGDQKLTICNGAVMDGVNASGALIDIKNNSHVTVEIENSAILTEKGMKFFSQTPEDGTLTTGTINLRLNGANLKHTKVEVSAASMNTKSYVIVQNCILEDSPLSLPNNSRVMIANNLVI